MLAIRQAGEESIDIYGEAFLIERPMLAALRAPDATVLLIDEIDRADQEFEAFLLEFLSDFQISIPERGTLRAAELANVPFLLYPKPSNVRRAIDGFFKEIGVLPNVQMEADDTEAIKRLVESGFGYSILPEHALRGRSHFFQKFRVEGHRIKRKVALAMVHTESPRKLTEAIAAFLRGVLAAQE